MKNKILIFAIFLCVFFVVIQIRPQNTYKSKTVVYNGNNLRISIDDVEINSLPKEGNYYLVDYDCNNANTVVTWDNKNYRLEVSNNGKKGGVACYLKFKSQPLLSEMPKGSYVRYTGDNGCIGSSCLGENANYDSEENMGYCNSKDYKFTTTGWRIGYVKDGSAYLISAGAPECICSNNSGGSSNSSCGSFEGTNGMPLFLDNLNDVALKYCNIEFAKGGVCNSSTAWAMNEADFTNIVGSNTLLNSCFQKFSNYTCGYTNDLIDNGSYYWYSGIYQNNSNLAFYWSPYLRYINNSNSSMVFGVRPVLNLESSVVVVSGSGTSSDPYLIGNNTFWVNDGNNNINIKDKSNIKLKLLSTGATEMCISTNTSVCTNYVKFSTTYTLDWSEEEASEKVIYIYYKDKDGKVIAAMDKTVKLVES